MRVHVLRPLLWRSSPPRMSSVQNELCRAHSIGWPNLIVVETLSTTPIVVNISGPQHMLPFGVSLLLSDHLSSLLKQQGIRFSTTPMNIAEAFDYPIRLGDPDCLTDSEYMRYGEATCVEIAQDIASGVKCPPPKWNLGLIKCKTVKISQVKGDASYRSIVIDQHSELGINSEYYFQPNVVAQDGMFDSVGAYCFSQAAWDVVSPYLDRRVFYSCFIDV